MKKLIIAALLLCATASYAQQTIDVDRLSTLISNKQEELKTQVLKNIVVKNIRPTNYVTYNAIYNLVGILVTEKNKTVMTQNIVQQIGDYSVNYLLADNFLKRQGVRNLLSENLNPLPAGARNDSLVARARYLLSKTFLLKSDSSALSSFSRFNFSNDSTKANLVIQTRSKSQVKIGGISSDYIKDFIIDTLHSLLKNCTALTSRGFFKDDPERSFFTHGLAVDSVYSKIKRATFFGRLIDSLTAYVNGLPAAITSTSQVNVLAFIGIANINNLSDTSTTNKMIQDMLKLFDQAITQYRTQIGNNAFIATIGDIIVKYFVFSMNSQDPNKVFTFKIDVEAIILAFEEKFYDFSVTSIHKYKIGIKPFFSIGLNYGHFINSKNIFDNTDVAASTINQVEFAGEKLGFKFIYADWGYTRSHAPNEWYEYKGTERRWLGPVNKPLINNAYFFMWGSGLIYNIVDVKSNKSFNDPIIGIGGGLEFFNGLEANLSYVVPYMAHTSFNTMNSKAFINFGFDIPIFEYLKAATSKNK